MFRPADGSPALVGVVGPLQLDVLVDRLDREYGITVSFEQSEWQLARWIHCDDRARFNEFIAAHRSALAEDLDGDAVCLFRSAFYVDYTLQNWPGVTFTDIKDIHARNKLG